MRTKICVSPLCRRQCIQFLSKLDMAQDVVIRARGLPNNRVYYWPVSSVTVTFRCNMFALQSMENEIYVLTYFALKNIEALISFSKSLFMIHV